MSRTLIKFMSSRARTARTLTPALILPRPYYPSRPARLFSAMAPARTDQREAMFQLDLALSHLAKPERPEGYKDIRERGNTPSRAQDLIIFPDQMEGYPHPFCVDRILEHQTISRFFEAVYLGIMPDGRASAFPKLAAEEELTLVALPYCEWAPAPFASEQETPLALITKPMISIHESKQMVPVSAELFAMKSKLWEGIMPLSERRWQELALDAPENFSTACRYLAFAITTFDYLALPIVKAALRDTYNQVWDQLETFQGALNARRAPGQGPSRETINLTAQWHEFTKARFAAISTRAHGWVIDHLARLRGPLLEQLASHQPAELGPDYDDVQWMLTNRLQDLMENASQADCAMWLWMDGFKGEETPAAQAEEPLTDQDTRPYRENPITASVSPAKTNRDYHGRLRYLSRLEKWSDPEALNADLAAPINTPSAIVRTCRYQIAAQDKTRAELRSALTGPDGGCPPEPPSLASTELWVTDFRTQAKDEGGVPSWGYLAYRTCFEHSDEEWATFKTRFEADAADWGRELGDIDDIRAASVIQWRDVKDKDICGMCKGREALRKQFEADHEADPTGLRQNSFLIADRAAIDSYLRPSPPQQQQGGFILVVDARFDPAEVEAAAEGRAPAPDEEGWPNFDGSLCILGSLLWDDLGPRLMLDQMLGDMAPLAVQNPLHVYEGPLLVTRKGEGGRAT